MRMGRNKYKQRKIIRRKVKKMKINFQVFDSLPSPGSLSDALADKLRMSRTSLAEVVIMMTVVMTVLMTIIETVMMRMMRMMFDGKILISEHRGGFNCKRREVVTLPASRTLQRRFSALLKLK